jgi:ABC-type uncharacterized transport system substrate-binding protein
MRRMPSSSNETSPSPVLDLLGELVASKVDLILAMDYPAALAAKNGTTIPVVVLGAGDPVGTGLVDGLARPGGSAWRHEAQAARRLGLQC